MTRALALLLCLALQGCAKEPVSYRHPSQIAHGPLPLYRVTLAPRTDGVLVYTVPARSAEAARNIIVDGSWLAWVRDVRVERVKR